MKKIISAIAVLASLVSCSLTVEPISLKKVEEKSTPFEISGNFDETKTSIEEDGSVFHSFWDKDQTITVYVDVVSSTSYTATYDDNDGLFKGSIGKSLTEGSHIFYASSVSGRSGTKAVHYIPTTQTMPGINKIDPAADFLVADATPVDVDDSGALSTINMSFKRPIAFVKIIPVDKTSGGILGAKKIRSISINYPNKLPSKINYDLSGDTGVSTGDSKTDYTVTYEGSDFSFSNEVTGTNGAIFALAAGAFAKDKSITFTVELTDGSYDIQKTITKLGSAIEFGANTLRPITVSFGDSEVTPKLPSISSESISVAPSASGGIITYMVSNPVAGGVLSTETLAGATISNLSVGTPSDGSISFTCDANDSKVVKTATVRLTYTYNTDQTVTKDVTITQRGVAISDDAVADVPAAGLADNSGSYTVTFTDASGWTPSITAVDGTVVTAAVFADDTEVSSTPADYTVNYTVAPNTGDARDGSFTIRLTKGLVTLDQEITVSQLATGVSVTTNRYFVYVDNSGSTHYDARFTVAKGESAANIADVAGSNYSGISAGLPLTDYSANTGLSSYKKGVKMESATTISFTTGVVQSATVEIYAIARNTKTTGLNFNGVASSNLLHGGDTGAPTKLEYDLSSSTTYTISRGSDESAIVLIVLTETVKN